MTRKPRFEGRSVVVAGGASGIGLAAVKGLLAEGAKVAVFDVDLSRLDEMPIEAEAERLLVQQVDITSPASVERGVEAVTQRFDRLNGVVNAAGIDLSCGFDEMTLAQWDRIMTVNLTGPMIVCKATYPLLRAAAGGTIVNVSSGAGLLPAPGRLAYSTSKAALQMMGKSLALEAGAYGIRVNTVCPGAVETPLFRAGVPAGPEAEPFLEAVRKRYAMGRIAEVQEVAAAILWLTSDESSFVTGTAIAVDGGRTFH